MNEQSPVKGQDRQTSHDATPRGGVSHVVGDTSVPLWHRTIPDVFAETAGRCADREAAIFVEQGIRWPWAELAAEVDALIESFTVFPVNAGCLAASNAGGSSIPGVCY